MVSKIFDSGKITLIQGDITDQETNAIVNAANEFLQHGGGVARAIVEKGGSIIQDESNKIGHTPVGTAVITTAGMLKSKYVIHTVGPKMGEGEEDAKLFSATLSSLKLAKKHNLASIAFPAISTGIFGFPIERCAPLMLKACRNFLEESGFGLEIVFCLWSAKDYDQFEHVLHSLE